MVVAGGCHPNRPTIELLAGHGFATSGLERFALAMTFPLVRPHAQGGSRLS